MICPSRFAIAISAVALRRPRPGFVRVANVLVAAIVGHAALLSTALAAPSIGNISPPALRPGASVTLRIDGGDLAANPRLLLPVPIAEQSVKPGGNGNFVLLDVKVDAAAAPGIFLARIATDSGVSNGFPLAIDALPTVAVPTTLTQMPVAVAGELTGGNVVRTTFNGEKDQPILIEVEAQRLGGKLRPVVRLLDARGVQVAWAQGERRLGGDARLATRLPAAGTYTVELQDLLFRGEAPGRFRLKVGSWKYADLAMPLGIQAGTVASIAFVGGNIDEPALVDARGFASGMRPVAWPAGLAASGLRPAVVVSSYPELVENEQSGSGQALAAAPIGVSGCLSKAGEEDRYVVPVTPGQTVRIELLAEQLGSPVDGVAIVRNAQGGEMARGDDQRGTTDPAIDFQVPGGVNSIVVAVQDLLGRGGPSHVYRLSIAPAGYDRLNLAVAQDIASVAVGGRTLWRVAADRAGYDGPIRVTAPNLPAGVAVGGSEIPPGIDQGLAVVSGEQPAAGRVALVGEIRVGDVAIKRPAQAPDFPAAQTQPWLREELAVAVTGKSPIAADWAAAEALAIPAGGKVAAAVKIARGEGVAGPVRLTLLTTQTVPTKKADNRDVPDETKALRAEAVVVVPPEAAEGSLSILAPADLARLPYDLVVQADLLSADGKQVVATTYTQPRRAAIVDAAP